MAKKNTDVNNDTTAPAASGDGPIKVRATKAGYGPYDCYRRPGDVFVIPNASIFSKNWMERVDPDTPEKMTTRAEAMAQQGAGPSTTVPTGDTDVL